MVNILVVDDEIGRTGIIDSLIDDLREEPDFHVSASASAQDAERLLAETRHFDIVVLDIMMPYGPYDPDTAAHGQLTGLLLLDRIRESIPGIRAIIFTNKDLKEVKQEMGDREADAFIQKPVWTDDLIRIIREVA